MRTRTTKALLASVLTLAGSGALWADDSDIFISQGVQPNVVILIDTSGSMDDEVGGTRKITTARNVMSDVVNTVNGVRFGIFSFNSSADGARLVSPVGTAKATMVSAIQALNANGQTPLGRASQDIQTYFRGTFQVSGVTQPSPIQYECQGNYYILMTDGMPTGEDENLVADVATSFRTTDHATTLPGTQKVVVHTIGFDVPEGAALLAQTATNGSGRSYVVSDPAALKAALQAAISMIVEDAYSFTAPLIPTGSVGGGTRGFFASFRPNAGRPFWQGYLSAYTRNSQGLIPVGVGGLPDPSTLAWEAGALLAARSAATRTIFTTVAGARQDFTKANGNITAALLGLTSASDRDALVDFVRGLDAYDEDTDTNLTESRAWKLGDIFHSAPVLVGPPPLKSDDTSYDTFRQAHASRTRILLVGANDGMLHAFRETDGEELWAFIPPDLLGTLKNLRPLSVTHAYYVDSSPIVADIKVGTTWKTIAVFGERGGGRSYHALDVTDTTSPTHLWSFTDTRMGETWSEPAIARVKMADNTVRHVAFVGGGYDSANNNATGTAFFAIDLATGQKLWQYVNGGSGDSIHLNFSFAASPAAVDLDANGFVDRLYVGDVGGQLWKFDVGAPATLSGSLVNNWQGKRVFAASPTQQNPPPAGEYRPAQGMYARPVLAYDRDENLWVFVGTGDRSHPNDTSSNRFYGIKDDTPMTPGGALTETSLVNASATNATIGQGWYLPLGTREKVLSTAQTYADVVYFTTYTSNVTASCENPSGIAKSYAVQMGRGDAAFDPVTEAPLSGENATTASATVGGGIPSIPTIVQGNPNDAVVVATTEGEITDEDRPAAVRKQIRAWKETY